MTNYVKRFKLEYPEDILPKLELTDEQKVHFVGLYQFHYWNAMDEYEYGGLSRCCRRHLIMALAYAELINEQDEILNKVLWKKYKEWNKNHTEV